LPVLGCIPRLSSNGQALPPPDANKAVVNPILCTYSRPNSVEAEAYRGVRAALYFSTDGKPHKVIQVTSPTVGDGKTMLTANLAISIAQSGRKTLLIDADLRRPRIHQLFAHSARTGLATVIQGEASLDNAIQPSEIPGLSILPSGPLPPNPADLLTSPRFQQLLASAREKYDYVLVDTPALLAVTDPRVIAPLVDGVLLTFRMTKKSRPDVERSKEVLEDLQANVLGAVVNAADRYVEFTKYEQQMDGRTPPPNLGHQSPASAAS
jgi:succinoglycan biosynthesis transport protein ExoP